MQKKQFSIRSLIWGVFVLALACWLLQALISRNKPLSENELAAIDEIHSGGGCLYLRHVDFGFPTGKVVEVLIPVRCPDTDYELSRWEPQLTRLRRIDIYACGTNITESGIAKARRMKNIRLLVLNKTKGSGAKNE